MPRDTLEMTRKGNMIYDSAFFQSGQPHVPLYVANGSIGGCFDEFGFQSRPDFDMDHGRTHMGWVNHYVKHPSNGGHDLASLCFLTARTSEGRPLGLAGVREYRQEFDLATASFSTVWESDDGRYHVSAFASFATPQLFVWSLEQHLESSDTCLHLSLQFDTAQADKNGSHTGRNPAFGLESFSAVEIVPGTWEIVSGTNCRETRLLCRLEGAEARLDGTALQIVPMRSGSEIRFLVLDGPVAAEIAADPAAWLAGNDHRRRHETAAAGFWNTGGFVDFPVGPPAQVWLRSRYYLQASLPPFPTHVMEPTGLNANIWGHGFPQDMYYVVENLPRLGLQELADAQFPIWLEMLPGVIRYTKRLTGCDGAFFPWIPPFEDMDGFEVNGPTNPDSYEFHNSAYVAAMVWHSWEIAGDRKFLDQYRPILREVARFFSCLTEIPERGAARISHPLIRSQDEAMQPGMMAQSPLCAMLGARAVFKFYLGCCDVAGGDDHVLEARCREILARDFDFEALLRPDGTMKTTINDNRPQGFQKHPVQLNPIAYLPQPELLEKHPAFLDAWRNRWDLTMDAREPRSCGWTFAEFALASARMGDGEALRRDLDLVQPARYADGQWIQFYESSCLRGWQHKKPYYFTTNGLYLQALTDAICQYWRGTVDLFAALLPEWEEDAFSFRGLRTPGGIEVSGEWDAGCFHASFTASRAYSGTVRICRPGAVFEICTPEGILAGKGFEKIPLRLEAGGVARIESRASLPPSGEVRSNTEAAPRRPLKFF